MLSSIHPLGERARHNRWGVTVAAFTLGAVAAGGVVGAVLGAAGGVILGDLAGSMRLGLVAGLAIVAGLLDWARVSPPGPTRQVNETWIGYYRGSVYGGAFGIQLGLGFTTYIVTWGVYATFASELLAGSWQIGLIIGATFGLGRSLALLLAGWINRPSRLTSFHSGMNRLGPPVRVSGSVATLLLGAVALVGVWV